MAAADGRGGRAQKELCDALAGLARSLARLTYSQSRSGLFRAARTARRVLSLLHISSFIRGHLRNSLFHIVLRLSKRTHRTTFARTRHDETFPRLLVTFFPIELNEYISLLVTMRYKQMSVFDARYLSFLGT